jgi:hypothetical protein
MKKYLLTIPEPIVDYALYPKFLETLKFEEKERIGELKKCVQELSNIRRKTLKKLIHLFYQIHLAAETTKMNAENLGKFCFC